METLTRNGLRSMFLSQHIYSIVGRGFLTPPILWRCPYIAYPPLFQILNNLPPHTVEPPTYTHARACTHTHTHTHTHFLLPCFFDFMGDCASSDVLCYSVTSWIYICGFLLVLWFDIRHPNKRHTRVTRLTHPYKYILTPPVVYY